MACLVNKSSMLFTVVNYYVNLQLFVGSSRNFHINDYINDNFRSGILNDGWKQSILSTLKPYLILFINMISFFFVGKSNIIILCKVDA